MSNVIKTKEIDYRTNEMTFRGFVAYPNRSEKRPGVLVASDWTGRNQSMCERAIKLAQLGYVGFAVDVYGDAKVGCNRDENRALMTPLLEDRQELITRLHAALDTLQALPEVSKQHTAAIGYCFGGLCVLDIARTRADVLGVVSFHGRLTEPPFKTLDTVSAKIMALHGFDDTLIPMQQLLDLGAEMTRKKADWQAQLYGHASHSFAIVGANDFELGLHYNEVADRRSWASCTVFLEELFVK